MNAVSRPAAPRSGRAPRRTSCLPMAAFCAVILLVTGAILLRLAGAILVTADPIHPADAAVVLSGGDNTRIDEAVLLYEEKYMEYIILTETEIPIPEKGAEYSTLMRYVTMQKGVPGNQVLITKQQSESTLDEARSVLALMKQRGLDSLIVVTDPYHTFRTRLIFRQVFANEGIRVMVHPVRDHWYTSSGWWLHRQGWKVTVQEYFKLAGYLILQRE
ncbi:MAG: YdcF family protein [Anaerolineaceae bacterium]